MTMIRFAAFRVAATRHHHHHHHHHHNHHYGQGILLRCFAQSTSTLALSSSTLLTSLVGRVSHHGSVPTPPTRIQSYHTTTSRCSILEAATISDATASSSDSSTTTVQSSSSSNPTSGYSTIRHEEIMEQCGELYDSLSALSNQKLGGTAIPPSSDRATSLPFCLLVGNHSSGKSSFINYILQRNIQKAGVAPTDDTFTVIAPGLEDTDADGPTMVGDPDLGFSSLRQFGPTLIHHTQLKVRKSPLSFMLVDSPGMIDAPTTSSGTTSGEDAQQHYYGTKKNMDRGYDFQGVVRWLAQRADIVLLFFDPDKPGTTGETMSVLLNSLSGMDHKLLIVLNKADQFHKIHDFARAYGSLCWNLSKVIPRKDLPPIFTMSLPNNANGNKQGTTTATLSSSLSDLEHTRDDVVEQVLQAPKRRVDNVITNLYDSTSMLLLYSKIWNDVANRYKKEWRACRLQELGWSIVGLVSFGACHHLDLDVMYQGSILGSTIVGVGGLTWYHQIYLSRVQDELSSPEFLSSSFQRTHARQVQDADEYIASLWQRARDILQTSIRTAFDMNSASIISPNSGQTMVTKKELEMLQSILDVEIPKLRRLASEATKK